MTDEQAERLINALDRFIEKMDRIMEPLGWPANWLPAQQWPQMPVPTYPVPAYPVARPNCPCPPGTICGNVACPYRVQVTAAQTAVAPDPILPPMTWRCTNRPPQ